MHVQIANIGLNKTLGDRAFAVAAPALGNKLPPQQTIILTILNFYLRLLFLGRLLFVIFNRFILALRSFI